MNWIHTFKKEQSHFWVFLLYGVIAAALIAPIASPKNIPAMADFINHLAEIIQAKSALFSGQFPLRIAPLWAYPIYQFYSPSTYLIAGMIDGFLTHQNPLVAYQMTTWLGLVLGGVYMARVAFWFTRQRIAAWLSGIVYMAAPYNIITQFRIGDLNEGLALGILPVVLFYALQYFSKAHSKTRFKIAIAYYFLLTTHLVTAIYFSLFLFLMLSFVTIKNKRHWQHLLSVLISLGCGALLASWFLVPVLFFQKFLYVSGTYHTTAYLTMFKPVLANLFSMAALVTPGSTSAVATLHPEMGWPILLGFGIGVYVFCNRLTFFSKRADYWVPILLLIFLMVFFCVWTPFNFWKWLPSVLLVAQYSWRLLGQLMWVGAILFAFSITWLFKNQLDRRHFLMGAFLIMMSVTPWFFSPNTFHVSLKDFKEKPFLVYNSNAYLINFNEYPQFVKEVHNILLEVNNFSNLDKPINIPYPLLKINAFPEISLQGNIPENLAKKSFSWVASTNHQVLARGNISAGDFLWKIPLPQYVQLKPSEKLLPVHIDLYQHGKKISTWFNSPIEKVTLNGFMDSSTILNIKQMQKVCSPEGDRTVCHVNISSRISTIELPTYYYPEMYQVTLNNKPMAYHGILEGATLLMGITPNSTGESIISFKFSGIPWANRVSEIAWGFFVLYGIFIWMRFNSYKNIV